MGLSVSTVSRALSGSGRVSEATRQNIAEYLKEKELVPNTRTKKYTDLETRMIGVTIPEEDFFLKPYFQTVFSSVYDYFSIRDYHVVPIKIHSKDISDLKNAVSNHIIDGVIVSSQNENTDEIELLKEYGVPFVVIGTMDLPDVLQIETDIEGACFDLTNALICKGYHKIAVMCAKHTLLNQKRFDGILNAHVQNYMVLDRKFVFWGTETESIAELAVEKILAGNMDCILCMDDNLCLKVLLILRKLDVKSPQDIKIASLHNSVLLDQWHPSVTCIHYDTNQIGREAGKMLYTCLTEKQKLSRVKVGYEIQMRESTG